MLVRIEQAVRAAVLTVSEGQLHTKLKTGGYLTQEFELDRQLEFRELFGERCDGYVVLAARACIWDGLRWYVRAIGETREGTERIAAWLAVQDREAAS